MFGSIDLLFTYRSLSLRPYKTSELAAVTLATVILLLITAIHTKVVLLLQAAAKVLQCLIKLYFKTQRTTKFITLWLLVALSSDNFSSVSIYGSASIDYH